MDYMSALAVAFAMKGVGDDDKYGSCVVWQCSGTVYLVTAAERVIFSPNSNNYQVEVKLYHFYEW